MTHESKPGAPIADTPPQLDRAGKRSRSFVIPNSGGRLRAIPMLRFDGAAVFAFSRKQEG